MADTQATECEGYLKRLVEAMEAQNEYFKIILSFIGVSNEVIEDVLNAEKDEK